MSFVTTRVLGTKLFSSTLPHNYNNYTLYFHRQKVPGHIGAVNMTIPGNHADVQFQVSATVEVDGVENEGELSEITTESIVFVPSAGKF